MLKMFKAFDKIHFCNRRGILIFPLTVDRSCYKINYIFFKLRHKYMDKFEDAYQEKIVGLLSIKKNIYNKPVFTH